MLARCPERWAGAAFALVLGLGLAGCSSAREAAPPPRQAKASPQLAAAPWPEADRLFRRDPGWLGGDAAVSIELASERVLWLFGDSFVAPREPGARATAHFVRNSVAIQQGKDPSRAEMRFFHGRARDGSPAAFFPEQDEVWLWPGHGLYREGVLIVFMMRVREQPPEPGSLGFRVAGWTALRVPNADADPDAWQLVPLRTPGTSGLIVGVQVLLEDAYVYAYAVREPGDHAVLLLRWTLDEFLEGDLMRPSCYGGEAYGFGEAVPCTVVLPAGATEFSVSPAPFGGYVQVQSRGFGAAPISVRFAPRLTGPFGSARVAYVPEEAGRGGVLLYAARGHPELDGADLVVTYATNALDPSRLFAEPELYYPRFVRLAFSP